ncbi:FecR family protein [Pontibacter liquoris]|uniref:FecR family protein n=1 Tax=Pontibacter liquoris TaxID=2905677 RepID=UPI001FA6B047|nr:FecR domain-containing protein [Pontibacter liquoris]
MESNYYWDIAAKSLEGKATPAEEKALRHWLAQDPAHEAQYKLQQQLWHLTTPATAPAPDTDAAWQKIRSRLQQSSQVKEANVIPLYRQVLRVAASVAILIGLAWVIKLYFFPFYGMQVVASGNKQITVILPDSSRVWLNKESTLAYDPDFDGRQREVYLKGEAFFEVTRNPQHPFVIETEATKTQVLGTSFNLRAYPGAEVELAVATGRVAFTAINGAARVIVTPGYAATLNTQQNSIRKYSLTDKNAWAWKTHELQFNGEPLQEVLAVLERYYHVKLELQSPAVGNCRFTGTFRGDNLQEVLQVLEVSLQVRSTKQNDHTYILAGEGCR